ncbi:MAG TPA: glutathione S-transferase family protein [Asticcacaulis sp.]|nr:glutathione S-transferase family protein [Asticcacaulis sp.]
MKLFINSGSPFARKTRIVVREKGLLSGVEEVFTVPVESRPDLVAANPVAQIPALVTDDDRKFCDSTLICAWLDAHAANGPCLVPAGNAYWDMRQVEALGAAMLEMLVKMVLERRRPENEQSPFWLQRWETNLMRGFGDAEALCPSADVLDMGSITLAIAATYTDFRYPHLDWRAVAPRIAALHDQLEKRPSFIDTYPK